MFVIPQVGKMIRRAARWPHIITTVVVCLVLLVFACVSYQNAKQTLEFQRAQVIDQKIATIEDAINKRMDENANMTRAGAALFDGSEAVTTTEWNRFFDKFDIDSRYAGITSIGYTPIVSQGETAAFINTLRKQGLDTAIITPAGTRSEYAPVMYIQTYKETQGLHGLDMFASPERKSAMEQARDTGKVTITDGITLASSHKLGTALFSPVYLRDVPLRTVDDRRAAIKGYVFTGVKIEQLLETVLPKADASSLGIVVSELHTNKLPLKIYSTLDSGHAKNLKKVSLSNMEINGKRWQVTLYANDNIVSETERDRPATMLAGGIAISFIASLAVFLLIQYRTRSFALAEEHKLQQAKDELLSLASHQLRTPATGVKQYVGMVLEGFAGKVPKEQIELLGQAYKSNERQLQIINEFLYVAKLDSGSLTTTKHDFDLVPVVRDVVNEMQSDITEHKHDIRVVTLPVANISADEHSLRMIIENLVSNAVKYTKPGGKIFVELTHRDHELLLSVKDSGIGIAKKDLDMLFKQFSRIPNELSSVVNGSGIGLYLAQQLAHRNEGRIEIISQEGEGSVFTLHLPIKSVRKLTKFKK